MDGISNGNVQQAFSAAIQQSLLNTQMSAVNKLMEGAAVGLQQNSQPQMGLRMDAMGERGIGVNLNIVA